MNNLAQKKCLTYSETTQAFDQETSKKHLQHLKNWKMSDDAKWISKEFKFKNFLTTLKFVNQISEIAEQENHHPNIEFTWGYCKISIQTHKVNGLCENDFILAAKIDQIS
jgi:4a-hydroxytetrahydrobiopterin dehydratase